VDIVFAGHVVRPPTTASRCQTSREGRG
jgi:hypothetical protein